MVKKEVNKGDVFILPIDENENYGVGRILLSKSPILFVEFYKIVVSRDFDISTLKDYNIFYIQQCGDLGFKTKEWKVLGNVPLDKEYDPLSHFWWVKIVDYYLRKYKDFDEKSLELGAFEDFISSEEEIKKINAYRDGLAGHKFAEGYLAIKLEKEGLYSPLGEKIDHVKTVSVEKSFEKKKNNKEYPFSVEKDIISADLEEEDLYEKYYKLFEKYDIKGNGYAWEGLIKQVLKKENPSLLEHIKFDSDGSNFYAYVDLERARKEFIKTIVPIFSNIHQLETWLKKIDKDLLND